MRDVRGYNFEIKKRRERESHDLLFCLFFFTLWLIIHEENVFFSPVEFLLFFLLEKYIKPALNLLEK